MSEIARGEDSVRTLAEDEDGRNQSSLVPRDTPHPAHAPASADAIRPGENFRPPTGVVGSQSTNAVNVTVNNTVTAPPVQFVAGKTGHGLFTRLIWFVFVGWWLSALFILLGYLFSATLLLLPVGIWFLHRVPQAQTLRARTREFTQQFKDGAWVITEGTQRQRPFLLRAVYTLFIGLWVGAVWLSLAWLVSLLILTLPLSIWMIDRAPAVITLQKH